ncbi:MAG TPA: hypothetical protein VKG24_03455 [Pseudolabrys sp.]|nr:hypothetical protein [Pseudolabrys sp.]
MTETTDLNDPVLTGLSEDQEIALALEQLGASPSIKVTPPNPADPNLVLEGPNAARQAAEIWGSERAKYDTANAAALNPPTKVWSPGKTTFKSPVDAAEALTSARRESSIDELIATGLSATQARKLADQDPSPPVKINADGNIYDAAFAGSEKKLTKGGSLTQEEYMAAMDQHRAKQAESQAQLKQWAEWQLLDSQSIEDLHGTALREFPSLPSTEEEKAVWLADLERNNPAAYQRFMHLDTVYRQKQDALQAEQQPVEQPQPVQEQPVQPQAEHPPAQYQPLPMQPSHLAKVEGALLVRDQLDQIARNEFPDIHSVQDAAALAKVNPERAKRLVQLVGIRQQIQNQAWAEYQAGQQQARNVEQLRNHVAEQDRLAEQQIPELQDTRTAAWFQKEAANTLRSWGLTDQQLRTMHENGQFSAPVQMALADVVRARHGMLPAQRDAREALRSKRAPVPPVSLPIRPGVSHGVPHGNEVEVSRLVNALDNANARGASAQTQARIAAEAFAAARRAATGNRKPSNGGWM